MARPEKSDAEKLQKTVAFRLTQGDFDQYQKKFARSGLTQSEFFREHVLNNTTQVIAAASKLVASSDAKRAVFLLQKASNNINQLAHRANAEHRSSKLSEDTFSAIIEQLRQFNQFMLEETDKAIKC